MQNESSSTLFTFSKNRINNPTNKAQHRKILNHKGEKRFKSYKVRRTAPKQHTTHFWITLISLIWGFPCQLYNVRIYSIHLH